MNEIENIEIEITKIQDYFSSEKNQGKLRSKKLSKYVAAFDYIEKVLLVLSAKSGGVCIISSVSVVGAPVGIAAPSFILIFSLTTGLIKKLLSITRKKKKNQNVNEKRKNIRLNSVNSRT